MTVSSSGGPLWRRPEWPAAPFAVLSAGIIILLNNSRLFTLAVERIDLRSLAGLACLFTLFLALTGMVSLVFLLLGHQYVLKPLVIAALLLSAVLGYFTQELGVVFDVKMVRNIAETFRDNNRMEAFELLSFLIATRVFLFGVLPSALVLIPRIEYRTFRRELLSRSLYAGGLVILSAVMILANYRYMAYFTRQNRTLRYYATPTFAINSLSKYVASSCRGRRAPFVELGTDAVQRKSARTRTVGIMVVGETARADHFSLNGYARKTNPRLELRKIINYTNARASGTSTAYSVPCMFFLLGKKEYTPDRAACQSNVLDVLFGAGVKVVWIDNNSSSKGVADRIPTVDFRQGADPASPFYSDGEYYDEVLVGEVERCVKSTDGDLLIVLHTMGSHGPAYHRRYPATFEVFKPCCKLDSPQRCSQEEVSNAYDNTIVYTDHVLDRLIACLEACDASVSTFLLYASDHGESLGENGVYLHGLPDSIAPDAQTHVPMLAWLSDRLVADQGLDYATLQGSRRADVSHDHIAHTLLGLFEVRTSVYRESLDLFGSRAAK